MRISNFSFPFQFYQIFLLWSNILSEILVFSHFYLRKIALIVDNCPAHPDVNDLRAIELVFLPPNTTSHTQPMDQVKFGHWNWNRVLAVRCIITAFENNKEILSFSGLDVTEETIINFFSKAGISKD